MTPTEAQAYRKNVILSIFLTCLGYALFNISDAALKKMGGAFHFSQVLFITSVISFTLMTSYSWYKDKLRSFTTKKPKLMFMRAFLAQIVTVIVVTALPKVELTTFYTLVFISPFCVALLAAYFLGDKLGGKRLAVILFGFAVVLYIFFRPDSTLFSVWTVAILFSTFCYSCQLIIVRKLGNTESRPFMLAWGAVMSMLVSLPWLFTHFIAPTPFQWMLLLIIGTASCLGLICVSYAYQHAPSASMIAPYHYTQIIWGALLGYYIFGDVPNNETIVGATLIIMAGLYLIYSETKKPKHKAVELE